MTKKHKDLGQPKKALIFPRKSILIQSILSLVILEIEIHKTTVSTKTRQHYMFNKYTFLFLLNLKTERFKQLGTFESILFSFLYFNCNWNSVGWTEIGTCLFYEWIPATARVQNLECNFPRGWQMLSLK